MSSTERAARQRTRWRAYGYVIAVLGPPSFAGIAIPVRDAIQPATVALGMVLVVLAAAMLGGRGPAWAGALTSFLSFDVLHTRPYYRLHIDQPEELEIALVLLAIALLVGEITVAALDARENVLRAEFREARVGRILAMSAAGLDRQRLVHLIEQELVEELGLQAVRWEPDAHTTCHYRIDANGRLYRHADPLQGRRLRLPSEAVAIAVRAGERDFGQLVLTPRREQDAHPAQLSLAAHLAALLAAMLNEVPPQRSRRQEGD